MRSGDALVWAMNNELTQWFALQPFFTKWICVFSLVIPVILKFRLMTPHYFVFYWPYIIKNFQVHDPHGRGSIKYFV